MKAIFCLVAWIGFPAFTFAADEGQGLNCSIQAIHNGKLMDLAHDPRKVFSVSQENGHLVLSLDNARLNGGTTLVDGKIQIQSEGSGVYYRNLHIRLITAFREKLMIESTLTSKP